MWETLAPWLVGGGGIGLITILARVFLRLHEDAVNAERRRADDAVARAEAAEKRADLREVQMATLFRPAPKELE